jgi:hypothetical protein
MSINLLALIGKLTDLAPQLAERRLLRWSDTGMQSQYDVSSKPAGE